MDILPYLLSFIGVSVLLFFIFFIALNKAYSKVVKGGILSFKYYKRIILFFLLISVSTFGSYFLLSFFGYSPNLFSESEKQEKVILQNDEEIKRVIAFLDNYDNLSINDIQKEIPHLKTVFYKLKENVDYYNSKIVNATKEYSQKQLFADSLSRTTDSLNLISQNQFNVVFAEMEKRSKQDSIKAFFWGIVVSLIINLISSYIFERMKKH